MKILKRIGIALAIVVLLCLAFYKFWFLRKPDRNVPHNAAVFVSPANGKVVSVSKWNADLISVIKGDKGLIKVWTTDVDTAGTMVSIQLNVANVHYQRAVSDAKLLAEKHTLGDFNNAILMSNEYGIRFENEHNELLFETPTGKRYKVIQIAGFVARRIDDYVQPEQQVKQGDVIGLIKLGSQVTVILPHDVEVTCKNGDVLIDGESIIANVR